MDDSGSMSCRDDGVKSRWEYLIESFEGFVKERVSIGADDLISVIYHGSTSMIVAECQSNNDVINIVKGTNKRDEGTCFYKGVKLIE